MPSSPEMLQSSAKKTSPRRTRNEPPGQIKRPAESQNNGRATDGKPSIEAIIGHPFQTPTYVGGQCTVLLNGATAVVEGNASP